MNINRKAMKLHLKKLFNIYTGFEQFSILLTFSMEIMLFNLLLPAAPISYYRLDLPP